MIAVPETESELLFAQTAVPLLTEYGAKLKHLADEVQQFIGLAIPLTRAQGLRKDLAGTSDKGLDTLGKFMRRELSSIRSRPFT